MDQKALCNSKLSMKWPGHSLGWLSGCLLLELKIYNLSPPTSTYHHKIHLLHNLIFSKKPFEIPKGPWLHVFRRKKFLKFEKRFILYILLFLKRINLNQPINLDYLFTYNLVFNKIFEYTPFPPIFIRHLLLCLTSILPFFGEMSFPDPILFWC